MLALIFHVAEDHCKMLQISDCRYMVCDFQQCGILTSVDSDEPVHSPFKFGNSK